MAIKSVTEEVPDFAAAMERAGMKPAVRGAEERVPDFAAAMARAEQQASEQFREPRPVRGATAPEESELTWGETAKGAAEQLLPSTGRVLKEIGTAVAHPVQTGKAFGALGSAALGRAGIIEQTPEEKAQGDAILNALTSHYKETYGSMKGFKKALATDPASVLMDVTTPLTFIPTGGGGAAATAVRAARMMSPVDAALTLAGKAATEVAAPIARLSLSAASGIPMALQRTASMAGRAEPSGAAISAIRAKMPKASAAAVRGAAEKEGARLQNFFNTFKSKQGDPADLFQAGQKALSASQQEASDKFAKSAAGIAAEAKKPTFNLIDDAVLRAEKDLQIGGQILPSAFPKQRAILDEIKKLVADAKALSSIDYKDLDRIKRAVWEIGDRLGDTTGGSPATKVYNAAKQELINISPEYNNLMEQWQRHRIEMSDLQRQLTGRASSGAASAALAKMLRSAKTEDGRKLLDKLIEKNPEIQFMLAGAAMSDLTRGGFLGEAAKFGGMNALLFNPGLIPHFAAGALASSPRLTGELNYYLSRAGRRAGQIAPTAARAGVAAEVAQTPTMAPGPSASADDDLQRRQLQVESGGRQFTPTGEPVTSSKGATGIAQIMPTTGPEAASLADEEWNPERLRTDEAYNRRLGKAYLDKQIADFGGDTVAGLAAYNAGPGAVRRAMQRARVEGGNYLAYLPRETQDYVRKIMSGPAVAARGGRIQRASGGRTGMNHAAEAARLVSLAERGKKELGKRTEPLLQKHDDEVAVALSAANKAI
jgi:hypothetical protein